MSRNNVLAPLALILLAACSYNPNDYSGFDSIDPEEGWCADRSFSYSPEISDSIAEGSLQLFVRHTNDYPYSNLWVEVESVQPADSGRTATRLDTFCIELADVYGKWHGSGIGTSFQRTVELSPRFTIMRGTSLHLRHVMRPGRVTGLEQVGLIFNASGEWK